MNWLKLYYKNNKNAQLRIQQLVEMNATTSDPEQQLKNRMLAFADDYFQNPDESFAKDIFEANSYYPEVASFIEDELKTGINFAESLALAEQSILSVIGKKDRVIFPEYYDLLPESIRKKLEIRTLEKSGHFPFIDQLHEIKKIINEFILLLEQKEV